MADQNGAEEGINEEPGFWRLSFLIIIVLVGGWVIFFFNTLSAAGAPFFDSAEQLSSAAHRGDRQLTLYQAISLALENNPGMLQAQARINQAKALYAGARASFWPRLSLYGEYLQGDAPSSFLFKKIDARRLPLGIDFNHPGWFESWEAGLQVNWNLYAGGRNRLRREMAARELRTSQFDRNRLVNELSAAVMETYYTALAAREMVRIAYQAVDTMQRQLQSMQVRFEAGGVLKSDLLSIQVRLAAAEEDLIKASNDVEQIYAALSILLGLDADSDLQLAPSGTLSLRLPRTYGKAISQAMEARPELADVREQVAKAMTGLSLARAEYLPNLDLQFKYYFTDPEFFTYSKERENWHLGLVLNWELFSGYATHARVAHAGSVVRQMLAVDREQVLAVQLEVKHALLALETAEARVEVSRKNVAEAEEVLRLVTLEYEGGSATIERFLNAELARNQALVREAQAVWDYERTTAALGRALGCLQPVGRGMPGAEKRDDFPCGFVSEDIQPGGIW